MTNTKDTKKDAWGTLIAKKPTLNEITFNPRISPNFMLNDTNVNKTNHSILLSSMSRIYK